MNDPAELVAEQLDHNPRARLVAFAAGSGITPVMAIATATLAGSPDATFELVYANRSTVDVMFAEEIGDLKDRYPDRFTVHHILSRENRTSPLHTGRVDDEKLSLMLDRMLRAGDVEEWFLCGPFDMVQLARDELKDRGVPEERVRFELFSTGKPSSRDGQHGRVVEVKDNEPTYEVEFTLDGSSSTVDSLGPPGKPFSTPRCASVRMSPSPVPEASAAPAGRSW